GRMSPLAGPVLSIPAGRRDSCATACELWLSFPAPSTRGRAGGHKRSIVAPVWPGGFREQKRAQRIFRKLFQKGVLTGKDAPTYIATTDGDAAATRRTSLGLLELLGACNT